MVSREITVKNRSGLQSKSAALFIQKASGFNSEIWVIKDERKANAKSLLGLLSLGVAAGSSIIVTAEGKDEAEAVIGLEKYLLSDDLDI